jgi:hypothetical protein
VRSVRASAQCHANIRATHAKTLELAREDEIGPAATCVVGVSTVIDEAALTALRGRIELTIAAGGHAATLRGRVNPAFRPGDPLIVRRAPAVTRDAIVIDADAAAADLDRALAERLAEPGAPIDVTIAERPGEAAPGALVVGPGEDPAADLDLVTPLAADDAQRALEALAGGRRVALRTGLEDDQAAHLVGTAHDLGHDVLPAPGLGPRDAALLTAGVPGAAHAADIDAREGSPAGARWADCTVVANIPADRLGPWIDGAGERRGVIALDAGTPREQFMPWRAGDPIRIDGARGRTAILVAGGAAERVDRDGAVEQARDAIAAGASTRDAARILQDRGGLPRREAYDLALELAERTASTASVSRPDPRTSR